MQKGLLIVISAPSGSGKSTVREELMRRENFAYSVSATTRPPRAGEVNGVDYWFVTREQFEEKIRNGDMLEHAIYNGNYYGTPLREALRVVESGRNLLLEIEVEGARNVKARYPEAILILLLPPTFAVQEARLRGRATETEEKILERLARTKEELAFADAYDYVVYNHDGCDREAAAEIQAILQAERATLRRNAGVAEHYFAN